MLVMEEVEGNHFGGANMVNFEADVTNMPYDMSKLNF